ncbi:MAG: outer membrane beta-barrel protein [Pseudomonadota bacterium]
MSRTALNLTMVAAIAAAGMAVVPAANAADMIPPPPVIHVPETPKHYGGGWYLRGDISAGISKIGDVNYAGGVLDKARMTESIAVGVGAGRKFGDYFRGDLTVNQRFGAQFHGSTSGAIACDGVSPGACHSMSDQKLNTTEFMANAYIDLGKFKGVTPYVGGGLGVARTSFNGYNLMRNCFAVTATNTHCPGYTGVAVNNATSTQTFAGAKDWNFAWNLQAGVNVDLSHNTSLDIGYKYTRINDVKMTNDPSPTVFHNTKSLGFHDARIGVRYHF